jgi:uncharacterized membrane protein YdcZ (DUF606 family)
MAARVGFLAIHFLRACSYLFVGLVLALAETTSTGRGISDFQSYGQLKGIEYFADFVVVFFVLSATVLAGEIGVANFILMGVIGQIMSLMIIDHFGPFGAPIRPINFLQALCADMLLAALVIIQVANAK